MLVVSVDRLLHRQRRQVQRLLLVLRGVLSARLRLLCKYFKLPARVNSDYRCRCRRDCRSRDPLLVLRVATQAGAGERRDSDEFADGKV